MHITINKDSYATILKEGNALVAIEACALTRTVIDEICPVLLLTGSKASVLDAACEPPKGQGPLCFPALSSIVDRAAVQASGQWVHKTRCRTTVHRYQTVW